MQNRMPDTPFMIGANGLIADVSYNGFASPGMASVGLVPNIATGQTPNTNVPTPGPWIVTQLLPGSVMQLTGGGEVDLVSGSNALLGIGEGNPSSPLLGAGIRGSLQADLVTGAAGTVQGLAFVVGNVGPTTMYAGVSLDTANRPNFFITDNTGTIQVHGTPTGSAILPGTPLQLRLFWDASGLVLLDFAAFLINGVAQSYTAPSGAWTPFIPVAVLYGSGAQGFGQTAFTGRFNKVQIGTKVVPTNSPIVPARSQTPL